MGTKASSEDVWSFSKLNQRIQWSYNKWYNAYIKKRIRYRFVREFWNCELVKFAGQANSTERAIIAKLNSSGLTQLMPFLDAVTTRVEASALCQQTKIKPVDLKKLLHRTYRYLPFGAQMRQLVSDSDTQMLTHVAALKQHKLAYSLALLDTGRTKAGRHALSLTSGVPEDALLDLVNRADFTRLSLMSGGMVKQLVALGYASIQTLKTADPDTYIQKAATYYTSHGRKGLPFDLTKKNAVEMIEKMKLAAQIVEQ